MHASQVLLVSENTALTGRPLPTALSRLSNEIEELAVLHPSDLSESTRAGIVAAVRKMDAARSYGIVVVHGFSLAYALACDPAFVGRLCPFIDDAPGQDRLPYAGVRSKLGKIASASRMLLTADEDERSHLEAFVPESAGKVLLSLAGIRQESSAGVVQPGRQATQVLLAGHDLKFAGELAEHLNRNQDFVLDIDQWESLHVHNAQLSRSRLENADVVVCEWAGGNAVWYSRHIGSDQRLVIRLHGFEVQGAWLRDIDISAVDAVVLVSEFFREQVLEATGWPREKTMVIPNTVNAADFCRSKEPGSEYRLGMVGMVPLFKRPDRALDILEELLSYEDRFTLHIRSRYPWEYDWFWNGRAAEQEAYRHFFDRLRQRPDLRSRVAFERFGPDMASWFRRIGYCLSPSYRETFHVAPLEAAASGAIPVLLNRPGAEEIFDSQWVFDGAKGAAEFIHATTAGQGTFEEQSAHAVAFAQRYDVSAVLPQWTSLLQAGSR